jgi:hypothetical protein
MIINGQILQRGWSVFAWVISANQGTLPARAPASSLHDRPSPQNTNMIDELTYTNCSRYCYFYASAHILDRVLVVCNYLKARLLSSPADCDTCSGADELN